MANKLLADSNRASLREIIEANDAWGTTPEAGVTRARRFRTSSITASKETATSEEIRDDRMVSSVIETAATSGGEIAWEFAAGTTDRDFQRALMGQWSRPMDFDVFRGKHVSITGAGAFQIAGLDKSAYFTVGRRIKLSGFVNPANNDYAQIASVSFTGGNTEVTVTGAALVAEEGTAFTAVQDANDVIVLKATGISFAGTTITGGGTLFQAPRQAGQLVPGQRIFVEGAGYEAGTITADTVVDGDSVTISDGEGSETFVAGTDFEVGADDEETAANLALAINKARASGALVVVAKVALAVVTVTNLRKTGGTLDGDATLATVAFSGGNADLGGFYQIKTVTDSTIVVDRALPTVAAGRPITIKGSMLRNPGSSSQITPQSATIETGFHDVGQFFTVDGLRCGSIEMEVSAGSIVTGQSTLMGKQTRRSKVEKLTGANYTALEAPSTEVVSATANVGSLSVNGIEQATAIRSIQFSIDGNLRNQQAVGSKFPIGIAAGRLNITGTIEAYFADGEMFDRFLAHETSSLAFPIIDEDANTYFFTIPAFKVLSDPVAPGGLDQDVMESMEFTAFRDPATACMIQIDRFSSTTPTTAF